MDGTEKNPKDIEKEKELDKNNIIQEKVVNFLTIMFQIKESISVLGDVYQNETNNINRMLIEMNEISTHIYTPGRIQELKTRWEGIKNTTDEVIGKIEGKLQENNLDNYEKCIEYLNGTEFDIKDQEQERVNMEIKEKIMKNRQNDVVIQNLKNSFHESTNRVIEQIKENNKLIIKNKMMDDYKTLLTQIKTNKEANKNPARILLDTAIFIEEHKIYNNKSIRRQLKRTLTDLINNISNKEALTKILKTKELKSIYTKIFRE